MFCCVLCHVLKGRGVIVSSQYFCLTAACYGISYVICMFYLMSKFTSNQEERGSPYPVAIPLLLTLRSFHFISMSCLSVLMRQLGAWELMEPVIECTDNNGNKNKICKQTNINTNKQKMTIYIRSQHTPFSIAILYFTLNLIFNKCTNYGIGIGRK